MRKLATFAEVALTFFSEEAAWLPGIFTVGSAGILMVGCRRPPSKEQISIGREAETVETYSASPDEVVE